jgi:hypothetical protein
MEHFDSEDLDPLPVMDDLVWVYRLRGRFDDAESLLENVWQSRIKHLGPHHRHTRCWSNASHGLRVIDW